MSLLISILPSSSVSSIPFKMLGYFSNFHKLALICQSPFFFVCIMEHVIMGSLICKKLFPRRPLRRILVWPVYKHRSYNNLQLFSSGAGLAAILLINSECNQSWAKKITNAEWFMHNTVARNQTIPAIYRDHFYTAGGWRV